VANASPKKGKREFAEELDRPVERPVNEVDHQQIEQNASDATDPVFRFAEPARVVGDSDLSDARTFPGGVDRDETVHLAIEADILEDLATVGLEGAAVIVQRHAQQGGDQPIGDDRGEPAG
jgi:hypothetical protein